MIFLNLIIAESRVYKVVIINKGIFGWVRSCHGVQLPLAFLSERLAQAIAISRSSSTAMTDIRVIIVDDDPVIRRNLRALAEKLGAYVMAEAENGYGAIDEVERHHPELLLLDISMPVMGGFPALRHLREHTPELRVILVSQFNQSVYAQEALQAGARGYVVKAAAATELGPAIDTVMAGGTFVSPNVGS